MVFNSIKSALKDKNTAKIVELQPQKEHNDLKTTEPISYNQIDNTIVITRILNYQRDSIVNSVGESLGVLDIENLNNTIAAFSIKYPNLFNTIDDRIKVDIALEFHAEKVNKDTFEKMLSEENKNLFKGKEPIFTIDENTVLSSVHVEYSKYVEQQKHLEQATAVGQKESTDINQTQNQYQK
jgi:hypothetical protein